MSETYQGDMAIGTIGGLGSTGVSEIVVAMINNKMVYDQSGVTSAIREVRASLEDNVSAGPVTAPEPSRSDVEMPTKAQIKKSITPDALISFIDGKPYKTLKRTLTRHGLDMAAYRERYGLPADYPSVAQNFSAARSEMAKKLGLGARSRTA